MVRGRNGRWYFIKDEPDIVKELREVEKLGGLQRKIHGTYEELETVEDSSEDVPDKTTCFFEEDDEPNVKMDDAARENTEKELQDTIDRYRFIFDNVNDEIIYLNKHGKILEVNKRSEDIFGCKPEEIIGKNFAKVVFFDVKELPKMLRFFKEIKSGKEIGLFELEVKHKDGHKIPVEASIRLIKKNGRTEGIVGIIRDITERKKTEEKLRECEVKYRNIVENANDFIFMIDKNNKVLYINRAATQLFRKKSEEIIGKSIFELFPKEIATGYSKNLKMVFKTGRHHFSETKMIVGKNEFWISVSLDPVRDHKGNKVAVMGVCREISKHKKAEEELKTTYEKLKRKVEELERYKKLTVGRELKMVKLKNWIKELEGGVKK